ncbi:MAG: hypothetical protein OEL87_03520 [Nanoarchaeota archaeon]|nr:hypothetical protein [Nanoarchaeota archaeon]
MSGDNKFDTTWEAKKFMDNVFIGPNLKEGLVLGSGESYKSTWVRGENEGMIQGLPEVNFYVLNSRSEMGREGVYDFLTISFRSPGPFDEDRDIYKYGENHKLVFGSKKCTAREMEYILEGDWVKNASMRQLEPREFSDILTFLCSPVGAELKDELRRRGLTSLTMDDPYIGKVVKKKWDDYFE